MATKAKAKARAKARIGTGRAGLAAAAAAARGLLAAPGGADARALRAGTEALLLAVETTLPRLALCDAIIRAAEGLAGSCGVDPGSGQDSLDWEELGRLEGHLTALDGRARPREPWIEGSEGGPDGR